MSVLRYSRKAVYKLLFQQLMTFVLISAAFGLNKMTWGVSAFIGGLAAWLPNVVFMLFSLYGKAQTSAQQPRQIAWFFVIIESLKIVCTIVLLIIALGVVKAEFLPLAVAYLAVLVVQIAAPAVMNNYQN